MHLEAQTDQYISSNLVPFHTSIRKGETIHTENSHKYLEQDIYELADSSQLKVENIFSDPRKWFSLVHFTI
jgi:L-histidine N-alpha-methyltransferase